MYFVDGVSNAANRKRLYTVWLETLDLYHINGFRILQHVPTTYILGRFIYVQTNAYIYNKDMYGFSSGYSQEKCQRVVPLLVHI